TWTCTDKGSYAVQVVVPEAQAGDCYTVQDYTTEKDDIYGVFYFTATSDGLEDPVPPSYDVTTFFVARNDGAFGLIAIKLAKNDNGYFLNVTTHDDGAYNDDYSTCNLTLNTNYRVKWHWKNNDAAEVWINGGACSDEKVADRTSDTSLDNEGVRYIELGASESQDAITVEFDNVAVDDDTYPSYCAGDS
ncbi:MAG: hypothetical protein ACXABY_34680, partial [Candidatus Thorarchaeota archaeon]